VTGSFGTASERGYERHQSAGDLELQGESGPATESMDRSKPPGPRSRRFASQPVRPAYKRQGSPGQRHPRRSGQAFGRLCLLAPTETSGDLRKAALGESAEEGGACLRTGGGFARIQDPRAQNPYCNAAPRPACPCVHYRFVVIKTSQDLRLHEGLFPGPRLCCSRVRNES